MSTARDTRPLARDVLARTFLVLLAGAVLATATLPVLLADDLPGELAIHWTASGQADDALSPSGLVGLALLLTAPCAAVLLAAACSRRGRPPGTWPVLTGAAALVSTVVAGTVPLAVGLSRTGLPWPATPGPSWWQLLGLVVAGLGLAAVAARAGNALPTTLEQVPAAPRLDVPAYSRVSWSGTATARWPLAASAVLVATGAALVLSVGQRWAGVGLALAGVAVCAMSHVQVYADRRGLTVAFGPLGWPRTRLPLADIASAAPVHVRPAEWGGWGYRGSLRVLRRAAVVLRSGPGIRVELTDGRVFAVTVDDAATGAAVLEHERAGAR